MRGKKRWAHDLRRKGKVKVLGEKEERSMWR